MYIKEITLRNFGPYGNVPQSIKFSDKAELVYVVAKNGSGKTTIINAINFALYGKVKELTQHDLINRVNKKETMVDIHLEASNKNIVLDNYNIFY